MGIRESLNRNPTTAAIVCGIAVVAVLAFVIVQFNRSSAGGPVPGGGNAWYTVDDGRTWFADDVGHLSPFDHNGKKAYRCYVWTCDDGKTQFVSHLERIKPERLKAFQAAGAKQSPDFFLPGMDMQVKPPLTGERGWTDYAVPAADAIRTPRCPAGQSGPPKPVAPK